MLITDGVHASAKLKTGFVLTERQGVASSTIASAIELAISSFLAATAFAELEHERHWLGLERGRVGSADAQESSACRPLGEAEIPSKPFAGMLGEVIGTVVFLSL